jgi:predicted DNA-binding protein
MPSSRSKTLSVIVPVEIQERLEKLAESKRWSVSQTARILIEESLDRIEADKDAKPK